MILTLIKITKCLVNKKTTFNLLIIKKTLLKNHKLIIDIEKIKLIKFLLFCFLLCIIFIDFIQCLIINNLSKYQIKICKSNYY